MAVTAAPSASAERRVRRGVMPRSLFGRSLLIVLLPLIILQLIVAYIFYVRHWDTVTRWLALGLAGETALIADMIEQRPQERESFLQLARERTSLALSFEPGADLDAAAKVAGIDDDTVPDTIREVFAEKLKRPFRIELRADQDDRFAVWVAADGGILRVLAEKKRLTSTTTTLFMLWMVGASAVLLLVAIYFLGRQVRPIRRLAEAADSFGKGRDIGDFRLEGATEIRRAGHAFNLMRQRILRFMHQRTDMLAAVSHDLRTPLTRMKLELAMMPKDDPAIADLTSDVEEMQRLVDVYLSFVRGEGREPPELVDLQAVLGEMAERAARGGAEVVLEPGPPVRLPLRPLAIRSCLANLVDNAVRHGRRIGLGLALGTHYVTVHVDDDGPGIPADQRDKVFQAFTRLDPARRRSTGGVGLGLTIARDVALGHGGDIDMSRSPLGGLRASLRLPR
ncbi:ATP-binding protein [Geminicoccus roseus]|uniref:ATP-binding protein n=1 Tax=Geminicoccus roseus TaxID=404900 RepID=UPI0006871CD4|nr:ATP-binding protein [Geminicoccus roseus]